MIRKNTLSIMVAITLLSLITMSCSDVNFSPEEELKARSATVGDSSPLIVPGEPGDGKNEPPVDPPTLSRRVNQVFYQQAEDPKVDILMIIDNSPSMVEEQEKIGQKISSFLGQLKNVDWQIGITTTDVSGGPFSTNGDLIRFKGSNSYLLNKNTSNYNRLFLDTIQRPESNCDTHCASTSEQPLRAAIMAMNKRDRENKGFFRNESDLALVIISDENEKSDGPPSATTPTQVINHFQSIWGTTKQFNAHAIIIRPGDKKCYDANLAGGGKFGTFANELALMTGGVVGSICEDDYGRTLAKIGQKVNSLLYSFTLSDEPEAGSVQILLTPQQDISWTVERKNIIFKKAPIDGSKIEVNYLTKLP